MKKIIEKLAPLQKYLIVISFLALEVFAFIAFNFGSSYILFGVLSLALLILLVLFTIKEINVDGVARVAILFFPLMLYVLLTAVGLYSYGHIQVGDYNLAEIVFIPIGVLSVALCGYLLSLNKTFKLKTFFIVIYSALAILVFLNLIVNLINFGFFHPFLYKDYYMYFGGLRSSITVDNMAYSLEAFKFIEVSMDHYALYPVLLLTSSLFLFYTSFKNEKKVFLLYLGFNVLAFFALLFIPSLCGLLGAVAVLVIDLLVYFSKKYLTIKKATKIGFIVLAVLASLFFALFIIIYQVPSFKVVVANTPVFGRLFVNNRLALKYAPMVYDLFNKERFFGYFYNPDQESVFGVVEAHLTGSYLVDNFMTSGVIGACVFILFLAFGLNGFKQWLFKEDDEEYRYKGVMATFFATFFIYSLIFSYGEYGIFYAVHKPIYMTSTFMLVVFMMFYAYSKATLKKKEKEEVVNE